MSNVYGRSDKIKDLLEIARPASWSAVDSYIQIEGEWSRKVSPKKNNSGNLLVCLTVCRIQNKPFYFCVLLFSEARDDSREQSSYRTRRRTQTWTTTGKKTAQALPLSTKEHWDPRSSSTKMGIWAWNVNSRFITGFWHFGMLSPKDYLSVNLRWIHYNSQ